MHYKKQSRQEEEEGNPKNIMCSDEAMLANTLALFFPVLGILLGIQIYQRHFKVATPITRGPSRSQEDIWSDSLVSSFEGPKIN